MKNNNTLKPLFDKAFWDGITLNSHCERAFTLAEILICLVVLGIIASLTIPTVIQKQREAANRTKIKKAMTVYDRMFAKMIVENNLKSDQAVRDFVKTDCSNTASYFKIAESLSTENSCTFKTSDGVFWNIEDIFHPIISLNKDDLDDLTSKNTFQMVTSFDPKTGAFRTNDLQYEIANDGDEEEMEKLFAFINNKISGAESNYNREASKIYDEDTHSCRGIDSNGVQRVTYAGCYGSCDNCNSSMLREIDEKNRETGLYSCDGQGENCKIRQKEIFVDEGNKTTQIHSVCDDSGVCTVSEIFISENGESKYWYTNCNGSSKIEDCVLYVDYTVDSYSPL